MPVSEPYAGYAVAMPSNISFITGFEMKVVTKG
jgi:hypothetical protein